MPGNKGVLLWVAHMLDAERGTRGARRVFVEFDRLLEDPPAVIDRIAAATGLPLSAREASTAAEIGEFLQPHLKSSATADFRNSTLLAPVARLHRYFVARARMEPADDRILAEAAAWMDDIETVFWPIIRDQIVRRTALQQEIRTLREQLAAQAAVNAQSAEAAALAAQLRPKRKPFKHALRTVRSAMEGSHRALKTARALVRRRRLI
jgi:hypothetical protein